MMIALVNLFFVCTFNLQAVHFWPAKCSIVQEYEGPLKIQQQKTSMTRYEQEIDVHLRLPAVLRTLVIQYVPDWVVGKEIRDRKSFFLKNRYPCCVYLSDDHIALGDDAGNIEICNVLTGLCERRIKAHGNDDSYKGLGIASIGYDSYSKRIISGGMNDGYIKVWDGQQCIKRFEPHRTYPYRSDISCLASLSNNIIVSGSVDDNGLYVWHQEAGEIVKMHSSVTASADSWGTISVAVMDATKCVSTLRCGPIIEWDIDAQKAIGDCRLDVRCLVAVSLDCNGYALTYKNGIALTDLRSTICHYLGGRKGEGHAGTVENMTRLGADVLSASADGTAKIWDVRMTSMCKDTIELGSARGILALASSPSGCSFAISFRKPKKVTIFNRARTNTMSEQ